MKGRQGSPNQSPEVRQDRECEKGQSPAFRSEGRGLRDLLCSLSLYGYRGDEEDTRRDSQSRGKV